MSASQAAELAELNSEVTVLRALLEAVRDVVVAPLPDVCTEENLRAFEFEQRGRALAVHTCVQMALENPAGALTWVSVLRDRQPLPYEADEAVSEGKEIAKADTGG